MIIYGDAVGRFARAFNESQIVYVLGVPCRVLFKRATTIDEEHGTVTPVAHVDLVPQTWPNIEGVGRKSTGT